MSDVSLELSGGRPQELDSLISNSTWIGNTRRLRDFYLCTPRGGTFICGCMLWPLSRLYCTGGERLEQGNYTAT